MRKKRDRIIPSFGQTLLFQILEQVHAYLLCKFRTALRLIPFGERKQIEIRLDIPCRIYKVERTKLSKQSGSCCSIVTKRHARTTLALL